MELISAKLAPANKIPEIFDWATRNLDENKFDPGVLNYPTTMVLQVGSKDKTILYMPVQTALMLESLAINPEATKHEIAVALRTVITSLILMAQKAGIGEMYFLGTSERTNEFARKHGLEELPYKAFRTKTFDEAQIESIPQSNS